MRDWSYLPWVSVILGIWLIIAPWVLRYSGDQPATWNSVIVGIIMLLVGLYVGYYSRRPTLP
ncbi:MAG: SPW repeat protein [Chloroflexi bacterium]|nr:SPW repeat protein [Chloroflexota bacterium]